MDDVTLLILWYFLAGLVLGWLSHWTWCGARAAARQPEEGNER